MRKCLVFCGLIQPPIDGGKFLAWAAIDGCTLITVKNEPDYVTAISQWMSYQLASTQGGTGHMHEMGAIQQTQKHFTQMRKASLLD